MFFHYYKKIKSGRAEEGKGHKIQLLHLIVKVLDYLLQILMYKFAGL